MKFNISWLLALLAVALILPATAGHKRDFERKFSETYPVGRDGRVSLDNRYGEITVNTWDRSDVKIDVRVKVAANSQDDADDVFDRIGIDLSGGNGYASATTSIGDRRGGSWWQEIFNWGGSSSSDFRIYYTVSLPASVELETKARYCDVRLPDLSGLNRIDVGYGDLVAGRLTARSEVDVSYGSARITELGSSSRFKIRYSEADIDRAGNLRYDGRYSETRIDRAESLTIDAGYEELVVGPVRGEVRMEGNYNELRLESATSAFLDGNYCDWEIGSLKKELSLDARYGDFNLDRLHAGFERVYADCSYIDVEIDIDSGAGYEVDLYARYGDIDVTDNLSPRNVSKEGSTEKVSGKVSGTGNGTIKISTSYGDIVLN